MRFLHWTTGKMNEGQVLNGRWQILHSYSSSNIRHLTMFILAVVRDFVIFRHINLQYFALSYTSFSFSFLFHYRLTFPQEGIFSLRNGFLNKVTIAQQQFQESIFICFTVSQQFYGTLKFSPDKSAIPTTSAVSHYG